MRNVMYVKLYVIFLFHIHITASAIQSVICAVISERLNIFIPVNVIVNVISVKKNE